MQEGVYGRRHRRGNERTGLYLTLAVLAFVVVCIGALGLWDAYRRRTQMQDDPRVARVWVIGTTFGPTHRLERGSSLQLWLNSHNISLLGDYEIVQSPYTNDPGSLEIWFNYESYLIDQPDLECHRIQTTGTAFVDDLGQPYHGFLDIHGKTIGVYLPGYDHSAHQIHCVLKWMPRRPAAPVPVSRPMAFTINLRRLPRLLPPAASLPRAAFASKNGITVSVDAARLSAFKQNNAAGSQRDITFRLKITGGELANDNVAADMTVLTPEPASPTRIGKSPRIGRSIDPPFSFRVSRGRGIGPAFPVRPLLSPVTLSSFETPMTLTDPYGIPLLAPGLSVTPLVTRETVRSARQGDGMVWVASVNNAGKGTDAIRLHLDVWPKAAPDQHGTAIMGSPVPFDLCVPVQTGDEI